MYNYATFNLVWNQKDIFI